MFRHGYACSDTGIQSDTGVLVQRQTTEHHFLGGGIIVGCQELAVLDLISLYGEKDRKWTEIYGTGIGPSVQCPLANHGCHMTFSGNISYITMT